MGLIVGKFMPLHNGHVYLIETALQECEHLTILLIAQHGDPISGETRGEWIRALFPSVDCVIHDTVLPKDETGVGHWDEWMTSIRLRLGTRSFTTLFSSEAYGERFATELGARHRMVDHKRTEVPVSATAVRSNPSTHIHYLPKIVRDYYTQKTV